VHMACTCARANAPFFVIYFQGRSHPKPCKTVDKHKSDYLSGSSFPSITANTFSMVAKVSFPCRWDSIIIEASFGLQDSQNVGIGKHRIGVVYVFESYEMKKTQELLPQDVWMLHRKKRRIFMVRCSLVRGSNEG
jgi:hypothetical protein